MSDEATNATTDTLAATSSEGSPTEISAKTNASEEGSPTSTPGGPSSSSSFLQPAPVDDVNAHPPPPAMDDNTSPSTDTSPTDTSSARGTDDLKKTSPVHGAQCRVKVYQLEPEGAWGDKGTGPLTYRHEGPHKLILSVIDEKSTEQAELLNHTVNPDNSHDYERQGDTIITWAEGSDSSEEMSDSLDVALSFQEADSCDEIYALITSANNSMTDEEGSIASYSSGDVDMTQPVSSIPFPELENLQEIEDILARLSLYEKDSASHHIIESGFLRKIFDLFKIAEDLELFSHLERIFNITRILLMWNDQNLLDFYYNENNIMDLIAALEYDPELRKKRQRTNPSPPQISRIHRDYINNSNKINILEFPTNLEGTIKQTFVLTYLRDVILFRYCDDPTQNSLSQFIQFNEIVIVNTIMGDMNFLNSLFELMKGVPLEVVQEKFNSEERRPSTPLLESSGSSGNIDPRHNETTSETKDEEILPLDDSKSEQSQIIGPQPQRTESNASTASLGLDSSPPEHQHSQNEESFTPVPIKNRKNYFLFFGELCTMVKRLTLKKAEFYEFLSNTNVFDMLEDVLDECRDVVKYHWVWMSLTGPLYEILTHRPHPFRQRCCMKYKNDEETLCGIFISSMCTPDRKFDSGLMYQIATIIVKSLELSQEPVLETGKSYAMPYLTSYHAYWESFFRVEIEKLVQALCHEANHQVARDMKFHCVELLSQCLRDHKVRAKEYNWDKAMTGVTRLIRGSDRRLVLAGIRLIRNLIAIKEKQFYDLVIQKRLFDDIIDVFVENGDSSNLLNSSILELFDRVLKECDCNTPENSDKDILTYIYNNKHFPKLRKIEYVEIFSRIASHCEEREQNSDVNGSTIVTPRCVNPGDASQRGESAWETTMEDESYFDGDDETSQAQVGAGEEENVPPPPPSQFVERQKTAQEEEFSLLGNPKLQNLVNQQSPPSSSTTSTTSSTAPSTSSSNILGKRKSMQFKIQLRTKKQATMAFETTHTHTLQQSPTPQSAALSTTTSPSSTTTTPSSSSTTTPSLISPSYNSCSASSTTVTSSSLSSKSDDRITLTTSSTLAPSSTLTHDANSDQEKKINGISTGHNTTTHHIEFIEGGIYESGLKSVPDGLSHPSSHSSGKTNDFVSATAHSSKESAPPHHKKQRVESNCC